MPDAEPFKFLHLPKELRLMVIERLPVKVTHRAWKTHTADDDSDIKLIWPTLPGVQILATSHQMKVEAGGILYPRLEAMRDARIRLIVKTDAVERLQNHALFHCIRHMDAQDFRRRFGVDMTHTPSWTAIGVRKEKHIHVAFRNATEHDAEHDAEQLDIMEEELSWSIYNFNRTLNQWSFNRGALEVLFRLAPCTAAEREAYSSKELSHVLNDLGQGIADMGYPEECWSRGCFIEQTEWEQDWAEGERSARWLFEKIGG